MDNIALYIDLTTGGFIEPSDNVLFNNVRFTNGDISYNAGTGTISLNRAGRYSIQWWVDTLTGGSARGLQFTLASVGASYPSHLHQQNRSNKRLCDY